MTTTNEMISKALDIGFSNAAALDPKTLVFKQEVRDMCAANKCKSYGKNWMCPPGCGTLEESAAKVSKYSRGIIVQTTMHLDDDFDIDTMMEAEKRQKECFEQMTDWIRKEYPGCLPMSVGTCTRCKQCTYPDAPCRFPDKTTTSMEAYGLVVSEVCKNAGIPYYYGPKTITYTGCYLID